MTNDSAREMILSYIGSHPAQLVQGRAMPADLSLTRPAMEPWRALWLVSAAHAIELRRGDVVDDAALSALAGSLAAARDSEVQSGRPRELASALDELIESRLPASVSGLASLGLANEERLATVVRLCWRDVVLRAAARALPLSEAALLLADTHVVTIMPAFLGGRPAQPTTLGHYLGPVLGPLAAARASLSSAFGRLNRGPLGAGLLVGDVLGADRDALARRLGFDEAIPNTLDAVSGVEDLVAAVEAMGAVVAPVLRFVQEIGAWVRTDPMSFVLDEGWTRLPEPAHPALVASERLDVLGHGLARVLVDLDGLRSRLRALPYGPLASAVDTVIGSACEHDAAMAAAMDDATALFSTGLVVNRAYLGNRAGRGYTTANDLATFLMTEEEIPPSAAHRISVLVLARLKDASLEVSGITQDMIDAAALSTIGREVKVEMEALGRYLAPRRFIERRQVTGSPATGMTRAWLAEERARLERDRAWLEGTRQSVDQALRALDAAIDEAAEASSDD